MVVAKKLGRIAAWITLGCCVFYLLLVQVASTYINSRQQTILPYIINQAQDHIRGRLTIQSITVTPWTNFPAIDFRLHNVGITDSSDRLPVLSLKTVATSFNILQLLVGKPVVSNLTLEDGSLELATDSTGYSNSIFRGNTAVAKEAPANPVSIERIKLRNISFSVKDSRKAKEISFYVHSLSAHVTASGAVQHVEMSEKISMAKGLGFNLDKGAYLENQSINGQWKLTFEPETKKLAIVAAKIAIGEQPFNLTGQFTFQNNDPTFKIGFASKKIKYELAKSIVSAHIRKKLALYDVQKPLDVDGKIDGSLLPAREPAVTINLQMDDNAVQTEAGLFSHCSITGNFTNAVNPQLPHVDSNSMIQFSRLRASWNGIPFSADSCRITHLDSALLQIHVQSQCRLQDIDNTLGMDNIGFTSGNAAFNLWYDGPILRDKSMLQGLRGTVKLEDAAIDYTARGFSFTHCNGLLELFKDSLRLADFTCKYRDNALAISVYGSHIRRGMASADSLQPALLNCSLSAGSINLDDFSSMFGKINHRTASKSARGSFAATARSLDEMLDNSVVLVNVRAGAIKKGNLHAGNLDATISFAPREWKLEKIAMNLAGGSIACSGLVKTGADNNHLASFTVNVLNANMSKLLFAFDNFGQEAISSRELNGRFSSLAVLTARLNAEGHVVPASINGSVDFSIKQAVLQDYEPLTRLKSFVFKKRDMREVHFAELKDKLSINGKLIAVSPIEVQSTAFRLFLEGNYCLEKKNTDLLIRVPFSNLNANSFDSTAGPINKGLDAKHGVSVWLRAVNDDSGKVKIKLTLKKKLKEV